MAVAVIGSINVDLFYKSSNDPLIGQTIEGDSYFIRHGGKCANQAVILRSLFEDTYFLGALGNDAFSKLSLDNLKEKSLSTNDIVLKDSQSGFALIKLKDNDNSITIFEGANGALNEEDVDQFFENHKDLQLIVLQLEIPLKLVEYIIELASKKKVKVILNPAPMKPIKSSVIDKCDYII
ncbi:PfkB family carbohydrate kinase, partial [Methanocalculus natronophilus]|uniref:PfkB family carbohydrate kinase n=1 Tax=Methanocalculus natronophilus TaxID=1262400 RepID=UPI0031B5ECAD